VTSAGKLELLDASTLARVGSYGLGIGTPRGALAAADLGGGRGLGFFVASREGFVGGYGGGGEPLPGWPVRATHGPLTSPALGDIDGDGSLDVVSVGPDPGTAAGGLLWAWNVDGLLKPGFPIKLHLFAGDSIPCALADLDGKPGAEIVVVDGGEYVHALRADGQELPGWPIQAWGGTPAAPVVGRGPSSPVVWVVNPGQYLALTPSGSVVVEGLTPPGQKLFDPALVDLDGDGADELVVSTSDQTYSVSLRGTASRWPATWIHVLGPPLAGHLSPSAPTGVLLVTDDGPKACAPNGSTLSDFGGRGVPAFTPTLGAPVVGDRTTVFTGLVPSGWLYSFAAPAGSWSSSPQAWPTQRGTSPGPAAASAHPPWRAPTTGRRRPWRT
jgi:hypothetical protein